MKKINEWLNKYNNELNGVVKEMSKIRNEIARLDSIGVELTAKANVLSGKIEALNEMSEFYKKNDRKNSNKKQDMTEVDSSADVDTKLDVEDWKKDLLDENMDTASFSEVGG